MRRIAFVVILAGVPAASAAEPVPELAALRKKADPYRPAAGQLVWRQVPWHTDPAAARKEAAAEGRPLFVWLAGGRDRDGSPLERC